MRVQRAELSMSIARIISLAVTFILVVQVIHPTSGHPIKIHRTYLTPPQRGFANERPEVAAAAQYVQYGSITGGKYKGSPYGNPRFQSSYDTSKRYYGLVSVSIPIISVIAMLIFLPSVTHLERRRRSLQDIFDFVPSKVPEQHRQKMLNRFYRAVERWKQ